ncbi:ABC transporter permease [Pelomicrobium sp.]|jgi:ABC-2 type transport system permease protein|uniref:ABC transporter permease n=1 Tax=Pelomicrobium sp. TaxID=2815319 RepID=UPI002FDD7A4E
MIARPLYAVLERELVKLFRQRGRLLSAMVRPLIWLFVIGAGFDALLDRGGPESYQYFLVPGVTGMAILFGAMLAALATVYDKESGVMRMLIIAPLRHAWIVAAKALSAACAALVQAALLLVLLGLLGYLSRGVDAPMLATGLLATAAACAALGMLVAAFTRTLDNYAVIMNLVIFPVFFLSGALYPVSTLPDPLRIAALLNPYTYGVDLLKHGMLANADSALAPDFSPTLDLTVLGAFTLAALALACWRFSRDSAYEPLIHAIARRRD